MDEGETMRKNAIEKQVLAVTIAVLFVCTLFLGASIGESWAICSTYGLPIFGSTKVAICLTVAFVLAEVVMTMRYLKLTHTEECLTRTPS